LTEITLQLFMLYESTFVANNFTQTNVIDKLKLAILLLLAVHKSNERNDATFKVS